VLVFLIISIIAAVFGFGGLAATASSIAEILWLKRSRTRGRPGDLLLPNHQSKAPSRKQASTGQIGGRSPSAGHAHDKRDQEDHQEYEEHARDVLGEARSRSNTVDKQQHRGPGEHDHRCGGGSGQKTDGPVVRAI
jgi:Protein of unknown function (DUF1328)